MLFFFILLLLVFSQIRGLLYNIPDQDDSTTECDRAISMFQDMERLGIPRDREAFHTLIHGLSRRGDFERAFIIFEEMVRERRIYFLFF